MIDLLEDLFAAFIITLVIFLICSMVYILIKAAVNDYSIEMLICSTSFLCVFLVIFVMLKYKQ